MRPILLVLGIVLTALGLLQLVFGREFLPFSPLFFVGLVLEIVLMVVGAILVGFGLRD